MTPRFKAGDKVTVLKLGKAGTSGLSSTSGCARGACCSDSARTPIPETSR